MKKKNTIVFPCDYDFHVYHAAVLTIVIRLHITSLVLIYLATGSLCFWKLQVPQSLQTLISDSSIKWNEQDVLGLPFLSLCFGKCLHTGSWCISMAQLSQLPFSQGSCMVLCSLLFSIWKSLFHVWCVIF